MGIKFKNNAFGVLSATLGGTVTDSTITLGTNEGDNFPVATGINGDWFFATLVDTSNNREIILCTVRASGSDTLTVLRAQDNTSVRAFAITDRLEMRPNAGSMDTLNFTNVISAVAAATTTLSIDANEHASFTNEISTGSTKNYSLVSTAGWFKIGELRASSETDGYASVTIHNSVDPDQEEPSRLEMQVSHKNGTFSGHAVVFGKSVASDNVHIHVVKKTSETAAPYSELEVYIMVHSNANAYISVRHFGGVEASWVKDLPSSIASLPAGYDTLWDSKDNLALTVSANGDTAVKGGLTAQGDISSTGVVTATSYVGDSTIPRVSTRVCIWEGSNGTVSNGIFSAPTADRQRYTINPSTHFSLSSGTFLKMDLEWQCVSPEDDILVGDVLPHSYTQHDSNEASWPIWHDNGGDFSNSAMRVEFNVGDYGNDNAIFHLWTRPRGSSTDAWYQKINFALYARIYYTT